MNRKPAVLAFCTTAIGDVMFCIPAIAALARKYAVDVLVHEKRAPLLEHNPNIRTIYKYRNNGFKRAWLAWKLRKNMYKSIAMLHVNDDVYKMLPWLRYEQAINIQGWNIPRLKLTALPSSQDMHNIDRPLLVAEACGADMPPMEERNPKIYLSPTDIAQARAWLQNNHVNAPVAGLVTGGSYAEKRWPLDRFVHLSKELENMGITTVLIGSRAEQHLLESFQQAGIKKLAPAFDLNLRLLSAVISRLSLVVTNDTGPLHMAHGLDVPSVSLFGLTDPRVIAPRHGPHRVISVYDHSLNRQEIMACISYDEVLAAVKQTINIPMADTGKNPILVV